MLIGRRIIGGSDVDVEAVRGLTIGGGPDVWPSGVGIVVSVDLVLVTP